MENKAAQHARAAKKAALCARAQPQYVKDAPAFADKFRLPPDQREALIALDLPRIVKMGAHPLVPFLAQLQIQRLRPRA